MNQPMGYRPYPPQAQGRSPANQRRPGQMPGGPHSQQQANLALQQQQAQAAAVAQQQQQQQQQRNIAIEHQLASRRSRKPTDKNIPEGVEEFIVGDGVTSYKDLREAEKRLDFAMTRKRLDIQDSLSRNLKRHKTMRIWISNTANNQPWQSSGIDEGGFEFASTGEGTYRVKIEGRVLDDPADERDLLEDSDDNDEDEEMADGDETEKKSKAVPQKKFTHFFKAITVDFDKSRGISTDPSAQVDWKRPGNVEYDSVEFERKGDENINITINLVRDETPERFRLSQALSQTLDLEEADRAEAVMGIWDYVKAQGLQEDDEKRTVRCDDRLRQIFGTEQVYFPSIPERIMPHLHPLPPVKLAYTIRVDEEYIENPVPTVYDVRVATDDPLRAKVMAMTQNPEYHNGLRQISQLDDNLALLIQALQHSKAKHSFYKAMAKDPVGFIQRWMSSQKRDLEVILGEASRGGGEDGSGPEFQKGGKGGVWDSAVVKEAVRYMLAKPDVGR